MFEAAPEGVPKPFTPQQVLPGLMVVATTAQKPGVSEGSPGIIGAAVWVSERQARVRVHGLRKWGFGQDLGQSPLSLLEQRQQRRILKGRPGPQRPSGSRCPVNRFQGRPQRPQTWEPYWNAITLSAGC